MRQNLVLIALLILITLFAAFYEGYFPIISVFLWGALIVGLAVTVWLAWSISTRRFLALILCTFIIEYVKEGMGIRSGVWVYHGTNSLYTFGVWAWVLAGLIVYTLSTKIFIPLLKKLRVSPPRWLNALILFLIFLIIPLAVGDYRQGAESLFWMFYGLLLVAGVYASTKMEFPVFIGLVITSWLVSHPSEYVGSAASGVWTFTHNPDYPPLFLLFGCWPLEILALYSLSAVIADEPLDV